MPRRNISAVLWWIISKNISNYPPPGMGFFKIPPIQWWAVFASPWRGTGLMTCCAQDRSRCHVHPCCVEALSGLTYFCPLS